MTDPTTGDEKAPTTDDDKARERAASAERRLDDMMQSHRHHTTEEMNKVRQELKDALADLSRNDKEERESLKAALKEAQDWIASEKKAREERDKVKGNSSTMVVPPNDVTPSSTPPPPAPETKPDQGGRKTAWRLW